MSAKQFTLHRRIPLLNRLTQWYSYYPAKKPDVTFCFDDTYTILLFLNHVEIGELVWEDFAETATLNFKKGSHIHYETKPFLSFFISQVISASFSRVSITTVWND